MTSVCRCSVIILTLVIYSEGRALEQCRAQTVMEGETGLLTFPLRDNIDAKSNIVQATLRRAKRPEHIIMVCEQHSPLECTVNDPADQNSSRIWHHELLLHIRNMSKELEDTYTLKIYVNGTMEPLQSCNLTVQSKPSSRTCIASSVIEGDTGVMTFFIGQDLASSDGFSATLTQNGDQGEILSCRRLTSSSYVKCVVLNKYFQTDGITQDHLIVLIPNIKKDFEGMYTLRVSADSTNASPELCFLQVKDVPADIKAQKENAVTPWIFYVIAIVVLIIAAVVISPTVRGIGNFLFRRCGLRWTAKVNKEGESSVPLLRLPDTKSHQNKRTRSGRADENEMALLSIDTDSPVQNYKNKRWYWSEANEKGDKLLVNRFWKNGPGAFLVRPSTINPANFVLVASFDGTVQHLTLVTTNRGVTCPSTKASFKTLCHVVKHYREKPIIVDGRLWGTLSKPFGRAPEENWYYGRLAAEYEDDVLLSSGRKSGSFLIADASTDADAYYLIVNTEGIIHRFGIAPNDVGFGMVETDLLRNTLTELVEYYKHNDIVTTAGKNFGKLSEQCPKEPYVHWFSETFTIDEERKILQSRRKRPGSFLVSKDDTNPNKYVLAVYFADEIKRFTVKEENNGFKLQNSEMIFYSWYELVDYYKKHDIEVRGSIVGKLSTPLRKEPEESCYIGRTSRMEERDLLLAGASGDFLIRDGITDPEAYVLAVNLEREIKHFDIYRENRGFRFCDTGEVRTTLGELVDFYKNTEIKVGDITFGTLVKEVKKVVTKGQAINASE